MKEKKAFKKIVATVLMVCVMVCTLTACTTTLKGTYTSKDGLIEQSFTFKEDNRLKCLLLVLMLRASV